MSYLFFRRSVILFVAAILGLLIASCNTEAKLQKRGGYLMARHSVDTDRPEISVYDLENFAQPKPNRRFLGIFRPGVWIYDAFSGKKNRKFSNWIRNKMGNPPVILDSALVDNSMIPMRVYLNNKGYFGAEVTREIKFRRARASVIYHIKTPEPFRFGTISYEIPDDSLKYFVNSSLDNTVLRSGMQYDAYLLRDERERIAKELKDIGYYAFSREYIFFEIDTTKGPKQADIRIYMQNMKLPKAGIHDSITETPHIRYFINNIYILANQPGLTADSTHVIDTLAYFSGSDTTSSVKPLFYLIYGDEYRIRPVALSRAVFIKPGEPFSQKKINLTYNRIQNLGLTRYVSVSVAPPNTGAVGIPYQYGLLDCDIRMMRTEVNMFTIEEETTNAGGYVGIGGSVNYRNRNIFRGAEVLRLKIYGALEIQPALVAGEQETKSYLFNSLEGGIETGLDFPTLLTPFKVKQFSENSRAKSTIQLGFNYQERTEYLRYLSSLSMGYEWNSTLTSRHIFYPVDISSVSILRDSAFTVYLNSLQDPRFLNQYTDHLVMAMKYSYIFNNQNLSKKKNFFYFRLNLESAGNVLNLYSNMNNGLRDEEGNFTIFGIRYSQYVRGDFDFRFFRTLNDKNQLVYRAAFGVGVPYGNSTALPFEKGFFAGGANGLRGWPVRSLGPGEYVSAGSNAFENIGDLWIEANLEYRFPIYSFLNGALFTDAGNIWLLKENEDFPGGNFQADKFFESMALDAGFGFRFDFSFFIFRIDGGLPLYDPGVVAGDRWVKFPKFQMRDINWSFGIGYPF